MEENSLPKVLPNPIATYGFKNDIPTVQRHFLRLLQ